MIDKFRLIRNVGRFESFSSGNGLDLKPLSLVYAENGRGKTTLCAILRSLSSGDPLPIDERRRLGSPHPPHVVIDLTGTTNGAVFQNNRWSTVFPDILIFDDVFVAENVYSGLDVDAAQRQGLHQIIIGKQGVALAREVEGLTQDIAAKQAIVRELGDRIPTAVRGRLTVDEFCDLAEHLDVDAAICEARKRLAALRQADTIQSTPSFDPFAFPNLDISALTALLSRGLPDLDTEAVRAVQAHLESLGKTAEHWVSGGMIYLAGDEERVSCPFCGQDLVGSSLVSHYRDYFGDAYNQLKTAILESFNSMKVLLGGDSLARFQRSIEAARTRHMFWRQFLDLPDMEVNIDCLAQIWSQAKDAALRLLELKRAAPLERIDIDQASRSSLDLNAELAANVVSLSQRLQECNPEITRIKEETRLGDLASAQTDIDRLTLAQARYQPDNNRFCSDYLDAKREKQRVEERKTAARKRLDKHRELVIPRFETAINELLRKFNTDFRIAKVEATNPRGTPSSTYCLEINNQRVPITGTQPRNGDPAFRNTLSSGDRNTLALAFFFSSLKLEPKLDSTVVVIDDPVTSLDDGRSVTTAQEIRELSGIAGQTIILSHSKQLLCSMWEYTDPKRCSSLEVRRSPGGSTIDLWDISDAAITEYDRRHARLRDCATGTFTDYRQVAQSLRPILEGFLRIACPEFFPPGTLLGRFITQAQSSLNAGQQILSQGDLAELEAIKEYANKFHHDTNKAWDSEVANINVQQLCGFVQRVLLFTRRPL